MLITAIILVSVTQVLFKVIANRHKDYLFDAIYDYRLYIAVIVYTLAFILWLVALSRIEFSIAIPLNIITVIIGGVFGYFLFSEEISILQIISYIIIISGILLLTYDAFK